MKRHRLIAVWILLATAGALTMRLPGLDRRPMHGDEAVHAIKFGGLWQSGAYHYDPEEYHGPTLYYLTLPLVWISGADDLGQTDARVFRLLPVLFGAGLILLLLLFVDGWGKAQTGCAAALIAVSPAMVFYSRYYIQETLLVFFTFLVIVAGWRYVVTKRAVWAIAAGVGAGLMHATKETSIIAFGSLLAALVLTAWWIRKGGGATSYRSYLRVPVLIGAVVAAALASSLLFSSFFTHPEGVIDAWRAYPTYFERAGGSGLHDHPWYYYFRLLLYTHYAPGPSWSEALILGLALIGAVVAVRGGGSNDTNTALLRFVTIYTVILALIYSTIPYKTPWCMLGFLHGMILLAGVGAVALVRILRFRSVQVVGAAVLIAACVQLGWQAHRGNTRFCADPRNPYVYAHPVNDAVRLAERIEQLAALHQDRDRMVVYVLGGDYWPLPWYLRRLQHVGYWEQFPEELDAPVLVATTDVSAELDERLREPYVSSFYGLRPDVALTLYVERTLWDEFLRGRATIRSSPTSGKERP